VLAVLGLLVAMTISTVAFGTTLTVQSAAAVTVATAPVTATAGQRQEYRYVDSTIGWVYW
jgi:hypothetical protein